MNVDKELLSRGTLVYQNEMVPVNVSYASRYSLHVNFLGSNNVINNTALPETGNTPNNMPERRFRSVSDMLFDGLKMELNGSTFELGKCRFVTDLENPQYNGKLFFTDDVYDLFEIFAAHRLIKLHDNFKNIAVILPQKNKVCQKFRDYTSNLTYDLNVYKSLFDDMDAKYKMEDPMISSVVQDLVIAKEGEAFNQFFDEKLNELEEIVNPFSNEEHAVHGYYFRKQLWDIIMSSEFMRRTNVKPRGYPGDSKMMTMLYENAYTGNSTFSKILNKHPMDAKAAQAVRNRIKIVGEVVSRANHNSTKEGEPYKILSLACGPAREMEYIFSTNDACHNYHVALFDQDNKAIEEAKGNISRVEQRLGNKINYSVIKDSIRTIISIPDLTGKWGTFNFIYALGLFDYLTDRVAQAVIPKIFSLLKPGGQLLIGNFHTTNPNKHYMAYWLDWLLYYRSEEELMNLTKNIGSEKEIFFDESGSQMFLRIIK